jgi:O-antigen ligase
VATARGLGLLLVLAAWAEARRGARRPPPAAWAAAALAVLVGASALWSHDLPASLRVAKHVGVEAVLLLSLGATPRRRVLWRALALGAAAGGALLLLAFAHALLVEPPLDRRLHLWGGDVNHQARAATLGLLSALLLRRRPRGWGWGLLAMIGGAAGSRGASLAGLAGFGLLASRGPRSRRAAAALAVLGLALGSFLPAARPDLRRPWNGVTDVDAARLTGGRDAVWANVVDIARDHPVLGVGAGAVPAVYEPYRRARMAAGGAHSKAARDAHSQYLECLADLGPAGLAILALLLLLAARGGPASAPLAAFAAASCLTVTTWESKAWWLAITLAALAPPPRAGPTAPR